MSRKRETYIFRLLHSAHACGVVILLVVPVTLDLLFSDASDVCFLGVTPWKVWNMPPWFGMGMAGAIFSSYFQACNIDQCQGCDGSASYRASNLRKLLMTKVLVGKIFLMRISNTKYLMIYKYPRVRHKLCRREMKMGCKFIYLAQQRMLDNSI